MPDRGLFITPYSIPTKVKEAFFQRSQDPVLKLVNLIDGELLVDLIQEHMQEILARFDLELQYRVRIAQLSNRIPESIRAFDLKEELRLEDIYVDASMEYHEPLLDRFSQTPTKSENVLLTQRGLSVLTEFCRTYVESEMSAPDSNPVVDKRRSSEYVRADLTPLFARLRERASSYLAGVRALLIDNTAAFDATKIAEDGLLLRRALHFLRRLPALEEYWGKLLASARDTNIDPEWRLISPSNLAGLRESVFVRGGPGSGKSTLLRRLCQLMAANQEGVPILLPLIDIEELSVNGLLVACRSVLIDHGYRLTQRRFLEMLNQGRITLLLDGLDEVGSKASEALTAIENFQDVHGRCRVIVSCRDTFEFSEWDRALPLHLRPLSDRQIPVFVKRWFSAEPTLQRDLLAWLKKMPHMMEIAKTPIVTALLCSLFKLGADMPSTEAEVYGRRFELLLGKWEQAKAITPLALAVRKRYMHYLRRVALVLHSEEQRSVGYGTALKLAKEYYVEELHRHPEGLVEDCVRRGVLERSENGSLSLGHLTYQEYLVAEWLSEQNPTHFIWKKLNDKWWKKALEFYAALKMDISGLLVVSKIKYIDDETVQRLRELLSLAPLTSKVSVNELEVSIRRLEKSRRYPVRTRTPADL